MNLWLYRQYLMLYLDGPENNLGLSVIPETSLQSALIALLFSLQVDACKACFISDR